MSEKKTLTQHGEVSYETRVCSSCGDEHPKEVSHVFAHGSLKSERERSYADKHEFVFEHGSVGQGYVCPVCCENDIVSFAQANSSTDSFWKRLKWLVWGDT